MSKAVDYKQFYKSPWGQAFIAYFVAMGLVGALTPPDILTAYTWTRPFTDFMAGIVPQIDKVTALGIDPDINRFYFSVMWAGSPVLVLIYVLGTLCDRHKHLTNPDGLFRSPLRKSVKPICILIFFGFLSFHVEWSAGVETRLTQSTFGTNLGRFAMPQAFVLGVVLPCIAGLTWAIGWLTGYIPRNIRKQNELEQSHGQ